MPESNPQPTRRWKRPVILALLLLAGGAVVNVAVGWYAAVWLWPARNFESPLPEVYWGEIDSTTSPITLTAAEVRWLRRNGLEPWASETRYRRQHEGFAHRNTSYARTMSEAWGGSRVLRVDCGWPLYAFSGVNNPGHFEIRRQTDAGSWIFFHLPAIAKRIVPYSIVPVLFAVNTLFYALLLWLLFFAPGSARRMLRRRRGLCEKCAYPIGVSAVCTECGAAVHSSARSI